MGDPAPQRRRPIDLRRAPARPRAGPLLAAAAACILLVAVGTGAGATTSTSVTLSVMSATSLSVAGCAPGVAGVTDLGTVLPGSRSTSWVDCDVSFGSSNDTSQLRLGQSDRLGVAMYSPTRGALDVGFDTDGRVTTTVGASTARDTAVAVTVQPDGRIVTAGECDLGATADDICVERYAADGSLDPTFSGDGRVSTDVGSEDRGYAVALQPDGRIVVGGYCDMGGATGIDSCVVRYDSNGSLDTSFDGDGIATTAGAPGAGTDYARAIAVQGDGRIVIAGRCDMGASGTDVCLARYRTDGSLDPSFDSDGKVTTAIGPGGSSDAAYAMALQKDSRIVVAGPCDMGAASGTDACLARYLPDGALDTAFDTDGRVTTATAPAAASDTAFTVALQPDGRIFTAGYCDMGGATGTDFCLARYLTNGSLDPAFDTDGRVTTATAPAAGNDFAFAVTLESDGRIAAAGRCDMGGATGGDMCLARYEANGSLDTTFGSNGRVTTAVAPGTAADVAWSAALRSDGRMVVAGSCDMGGTTGTDICLGAYAANGLASQYADDGVSDWDTGGTTARLFGACLRAVAAGATAQWPVAAACPAVDGPYWNAVPAAPTKIAMTAAPEPDPPDATASLRFGMRTSADQPPGRYVAPLTFEVLAPDA